MQAVFSCLLIFIIIYILFAHRKIDYFTIACFSALIYMYPGFFGELISQTGNYQTIQNSTYICASLWLFVLFIIMWLYDSSIFTWHNRPLFKETTVKTELKTDVYMNMAVLIIEIVELALCIYLINRNGGIFYDTTKAEMLENSTRGSSYVRYIALFTFVYSFVNNGKYINIMRILSSVFIIYTFLLGFRSFSVLAIICIFVFYIREDGKIRLINSIRKHKFIFIGAVIAALFFLFIKDTYTALFDGNFQLVFRRLTDLDYYKNSILNSEANTIFRNLQYMITDNVKYSVTNFLLSFITLIPLVGGQLAEALGYEAFSSSFNAAYNINASRGTGIASSYIGESYALGGYLGVILIAILTFVFIIILNKQLLSTKNGLAYTFISIALAYSTFYIYRNSLIYLLIMFRSQAYICLVVIILRMILAGTFSGHKNIKVK